MHVEGASQLQVDDARLDRQQENHRRPRSQLLHASPVAGGKPARQRQMLVLRQSVWQCSAYARLSLFMVQSLRKSGVLTIVLVSEELVHHFLHSFVRLLAPGSGAQGL